ncbi:isopropylmalate/homocitrate/citramalatesynthase [Leptospira ellinghausenii]|uniref:2-isopropylmalate synthase n=1 Tax=Leptospira ellinghausenii TaxID=1917822 RepID=A0A2P2D816_9LEPT|nr:2-isopropylmalate synthase LeuA2 [Leptospira ellinghausenii]GBF40769.1 isopropylmalate/homocitrate/citramalatesynthase [Leptospira ellinghausenii]
MKPKTIHIQDVTLRDGNQALKRPWTLNEKIEVFDLLVSLNVDGIEVGFPSSNESEFFTCQVLSKRAPKGKPIAALSRANEKEISVTWEAIQHADSPRMHIVYPVSDFSIKHVLKISEKEVLQKIKSSVSFARSIVGSNHQIQFSGEHFGDAIQNFEFTKLAFMTAIEAGANIINLPNTVERYRPMIFVNMVKEIRESIGDKAMISIHTHNDLGMATATSVESVYVGAEQIEVALNGLGERAGNTNLYETVIALHQNGESLNIQFDRIYPTAKRISELTGIPIGEKTPIIGEDIFSHRSGIHQDGVTKTMNQTKGAYRTFSPEFVGRFDKETISFTNQSGHKAIEFLLRQKGIEVSKEEIHHLFSVAKSISSKENNREITETELVELSRSILTYQ